MLKLSGLSRNKKAKRSSKARGKPGLKSKSGFSRKQLGLFALSFAAVGGYIVFKTFAATLVITNPTHLVDAQWNFSGSGYNLTSISTNISPKLSPAPDGYFYATEFYFYGNHTGYMGLQTQSQAIAGQITAKTASATIYGATSSTAAASNVYARCGNQSGEGSNCSLTMPYNWTAGRAYRFQLALQTANNGAGSEVWAASFTDLSTGVVYKLGTLKIPTTWQYLGHAVITFHERFSGPTYDCTLIKPSSVTFSNLKASNSAGSYTGSVGQPFLSVGNTQCSGLSNSVTNNVVYSNFKPPISSTSSSPPPTTNTTGTPVSSVAYSCLEGSAIALGPINGALCKGDGGTPGTACTWTTQPSPTWGACPTSSTPPPQVCPTGTTGTYPNCVANPPPPSRTALGSFYACLLEGSIVTGVSQGSCTGTGGTYGLACNWSLAPTPTWGACP